MLTTTDQMYLPWITHLCFKQYLCLTQNLQRPTNFWNQQIKWKTKWKNRNVRVFNIHTVHLRTKMITFKRHCDRCMWIFSIFWPYMNLHSRLSFNMSSYALFFVLYWCNENNVLNVWSIVFSFCFYIDSSLKM